MAGILQDIRVLDLDTSVAGGYCTKLLVGLGAQVLRLATPASRESLARRLWLHGAKTTVNRPGLDPDTLAPLLDRVDVVVEELDHAQRQQLGLAPETIVAHRPHLVRLSITPFGRSGPARDLAATETTLQAGAGLAGLTGDASGPPRTVPLPLCGITGGLHGCLAVLLALFRRRTQGHGADIDLSLQEAAMENIEIALATTLVTGKAKERGPHPGVPWDTYPTADGWATVIAMPARHWPRARTLFHDHRLTAPPYHHMVERLAHRRRFETLLAAELRRWRARDLWHQGQRLGLAFGYAATMEEVLANPQLEARGFFVPLAVAGRSPVPVCGAPFRIAGHHWRHEADGSRAGAPTPIPDGWQPRRRTAARSAPGQPLAGIRVLDLSHSWAAPHAGRLLADYGAQVIRVEYPGRLCILRGGRTADANYDRQPGFHQVNRNKAGITLDLERASHREILAQLAATADIWLENSRPGVFGRFGFGHDELRRRYPRLVVVAMSAFGQDGPWAHRAGYGAVFEGLAGIQTYNGGDGPPLRLREVDVLVGVMGAVAALAGLLFREVNGHGTVVDLAQLEAACHALMGEALLAAVLGEEQPDNAVLRTVFPCRDPAQWLAVEMDDQGWQRFRARAGLAPADHRRALAAWCAGQDRQAAVAALQRAGVAAAPVNTTLDLARDPHLAARRYFLSLAGRRYPGLPFRFTGAGRLFRRGPDLGEDNHRLAAWLGTAPGPTLVRPDPSQVATAFDLPAAGLEEAP